MLTRGCLSCLCLFAGRTAAGEEGSLRQQVLLLPTASRQGSVPFCMWIKPGPSLAICLLSCVLSGCNPISTAICSPQSYSHLRHIPGFSTRLCAASQHQGARNVETCSASKVLLSVPYPTTISQGPGDEMISPRAFISCVVLDCRECDSFSHEQLRHCPFCVMDDIASIDRSASPSSPPS